MWFLLSLFLLSCSGEKSLKSKNHQKDISIHKVKSKKSSFTHSKPLTENDFQKIILIDAEKGQQIKVNENTYMDFEPYFIGDLNDTIDFNSKWFQEDLWYAFEDKRNYSYPKKKDINIFVDTTRFIRVEVGFKNEKYIKSYPVFIENISKDSLIITSIMSLPIMIEVEFDNKWQEWIWGNYSIGCGNTSELLLPPGNILVTAFKIYEGNHRVKMRLVYGDKIYSNTFWGMIDSN